MTDKRPERITSALAEVSTQVKEQIDIDVGQNITDAYTVCLILRDAMLSVDYGVASGLSVFLSVCLSVCHTPVYC